MIDFVHLNWVSFKKEKPEKDNYYLFLIRNKKTGKSLVHMQYYYQFETKEGGVHDIFDGGNPDAEVIAWANPRRISFDVMPVNKGSCLDIDCTFSNDCSTCSKTLWLENAKWLDWFV